MPQPVRFIGDVHGKWHRYKQLLDGCVKSIQVGDFGVGFFDRHTQKLSTPPVDSMSKGVHRFIRGNHDNPKACREHPFWIPDGSLFDDSVFCIGGAASIDADFRTQGIDWWPDEELSYVELCSILDIYESTKPDIVVSHDAPESLCQKLCATGGLRMLATGSSTRKMLDNMIDIHRPSLWIHGHWHLDHHTVSQGVEFIGLGELSCVDIQL